MLIELHETYYIYGNFHKAIKELVHKIRIVSTFIMALNFYALAHEL